MKNILNHFLIILLFAFFTQCKKQKDPEQTTEASVFYFTGKVNGTNVSLASGMNNYYMFSNHSIASGNVREFTGELKQKNCQTNCNGSLKIIIKDYRDLNILPTVIDSSIRNKYYSYTSPNGTPNSFSVTFIPQFQGGTPQNHNWTFHNGTSNQASPTRIYTEPGNYNVCLTVQSTGSCSSSLCNNLKIGQLGNKVEVDFAVSTPTGNTLSFTAQPVLGTAPYSYQWNFGDGNSSTIAKPTHTYSSNGVYLVSLTVTDSKSNSATYNMNVNTQNPGSCMTKINMVKNAISNTNNLANVTIEWTDSNGNIYTSNNNVQSPICEFQITSVEEYIVNENGQKTKKIKALFNCTLLNGANSILLENGEAVFAIAYP